VAPQARGGRGPAWQAAWRGEPCGRAPRALGPRGAARRPLGLAAAKLAGRRGSSPMRSTQGMAGRLPHHHAAPARPAGGGWHQPVWADFHCVAAVLRARCHLGRVHKVGGRVGGGLRQAGRAGARAAAGGGRRVLSFIQPGELLLLAAAAAVCAGPAGGWCPPPSSPTSRPLLTTRWLAAGASPNGPPALAASRGEP